MELFDKIQELRKSKNMTQEELAEKLFVSRAAISKWESGRGYPSIDSLKELSKFFDVSLDDLLSNDELLSVAENDQQVKSNKTKDLVFGLLDISLLLFFFLPFFGQTVNGMIQEVSLLNLSNIENYIKIPYCIGTFALVVCGMITLTLQTSEWRLWVNCKSKISLFLSVILILIFIMTRQPYAAGFTFLFLTIKSMMLIKWK